jgi:hypothetical protein
MAQAPEIAPAAAPPVRRRRRWRWLLLPPLALMGVSLAYYFHSRSVVEKEPAAAIAETDRVDPGWRLEEIEASRTTYSIEENAAETVLAAHKLLPANWPPQPPTTTPLADAALDDPIEGDPLTPRLRSDGELASLEDRVSGLPPEVQPDPELLHDLRAELTRDGVKDALAATERLSRQTGGRYTVTWGPIPLNFTTPYQDARAVATLLEWQALLQDQDGQADEGLATARRIIIAGRSIGDEPTMIAQIVRFAMNAVARRVIERVLAQGLPSAAALADTQRLLKEDDAEPLLLYAFRGERAMQHGYAEWVEAGAAGARPPAWRERLQRLYMPHMTRRYHVAMLRMFSRAVEIARRPPEEQAEALGQLQMELGEIAPSPDDQAPATAEELLAALMPAFGKIGAAFLRDRAILRGAIVSLVLERYRLDHGRWPKELQELVPGCLPAVRRDPFDGREMRYTPLADGVIVYSMGPDRQDDGGAMNRRNITAAGTDIGFRLWDVTARRQPAAEALPMPNESN